MNATAFIAPIIRSVRSEDAAAIAALAQQMDSQTTTPTAAIIHQRLGKLLARPNCAVFVCVDEDDAVQGWVAAEQRLDLLQGDYIALVGLVVAQQQRQRGIGAALLTAVEAWCRRRGVNTICVCSASEQAQVHAFYQKMGYTHCQLQDAWRYQLAG